jgi:uncharacterized membrane protein YeaQ/YmgE (transglycosylase-associated protein family)
LPVFGYFRIIRPAMPFPVLREKQFAIWSREKRKMDAKGLIIWLIIGAIAGWLAGTLVRGGGFGLVGDIIVGIIGAFIGGWLAGVLGFGAGGGLIASIITATVGAIILILILRLVKSA